MLQYELRSNKVCHCTYNSLAATQIFAYKVFAPVIFCPCKCTTDTKQELLIQTNNAVDCNIDSVKKYILFTVDNAQFPTLLF